MADNKTWSDSQSFQLHSTSKTRLCFAPAAEPVSARLAGVCVLSRRPAGPEPFPPGPASSVWADPAETNRLKQPGHSLVPSHWTPLGPSLSFLVAWAIARCLSGSLSGQRVILAHLRLKWGSLQLRDRSGPCPPDQTKSLPVFSSLRLIRGFMGWNRSGKFQQ